MSNPEYARTNFAHFFDMALKTIAVAIEVAHKVGAGTGLEAPC